MNLNRIFLLGNLTRDPELRTTPSGQAVCTFSVATNRRWKAKTGALQEDTQYHTIVAWGRLAEICGQYLSKGRLVFVEGRLQTRSWDDQQGNKRYRTEIVAMTMQMGPQRVSGGGPAAEPYGSRPASAPGRAVQSEVDDEVAEEVPTIAMEEESGDEINVKDIPF